MAATALLVLENEETLETETPNNKTQQNNAINNINDLYTSYMGVSFAVFLSLLPKSTFSLLPTLQSRSHYLLHRLRKAEDELVQLRSRRQEDSKANARVVEIFATHRNAWRQEERQLRRKLNEATDELTRVRVRVSELEAKEAQLVNEVEELRREVGERDELLNFMSRHHQIDQTNENDNGDEFGGNDHENDNDNEERENGDLGFGEYDGGGAGFGSDFGVGVGVSSGGGSKFWGDCANNNNPWLQDVQYETLEPMHQSKHYVVRRESPWKVGGESTGVPSKLKLLEEELLNLEKVGKSNSSKVASTLRKQAKRYQDLAGKIDDLCRRMQASDPSEPALNSEFRSQRQTEFLLEAFQLQQRASETGKKLMALQTEIYSSYFGDDLGVEAKFAMRRSLDTIRNNFKELQRNLDVWLARIMGDLEGILARDGASRVRDYYFPRYPYVSSYN